MSDAQATPADELKWQILDPCTPKNEREHWAAREITRLRLLIRNEQIKPPFDVTDDMTTEFAIDIAERDRRIAELDVEIAQFMQENHGKTDVEFWQKRYYERRTQVFELEKKAHTSILEDIHGVSEMVEDQKARIAELEAENRQLRVRLRTLFYERLPNGVKIADLVDERMGLAIHALLQEEVAGGESEQSQEEQCDV